MIRHRHGEGRILPGPLKPVSPVASPLARDGAAEVGDGILDDRLRLDAVEDGAVTVGQGCGDGILDLIVQTGRDGNRAGEHEGADDPPADRIRAPHDRPSPARDDQHRQADPGDIGERHGRCLRGRPGRGGQGDDAGHDRADAWCPQEPESGPDDEATEEAIRAAPMDDDPICGFGHPCDRRRRCVGQTGQEQEQAEERETDDGQGAESIGGQAERGQTGGEHDSGQDKGRAEPDHHADRAPGATPGCRSQDQRNDRQRAWGDDREQTRDERGGQQDDHVAGVCRASMTRR